MIFSFSSFPVWFHPLEDTLVLLDPLGKVHKAPANLNNGSWVEMAKEEDQSPAVGSGDGDDDWADWE